MTFEESGSQPVQEIPCSPGRSVVQRARPSQIDLFGDKSAMAVRALLSALLSLSLPAHALNKCVDPGGGVSLQDTPCANTQTQTEIRVPKASSPASAARTVSPYAKDIARFARQEQEEKEQQERNMRISNAIFRHVVLVGMTEDEVIRSIGRPSLVNRSSYGPAQWVYSNGAASATYVYVENGTVRSLQETGVRPR